MTPLVSIVIPTYNRSSDLQRALRSVIAQTWTQWEAIVVDNHSTDDTETAVARCNDPRIRLLKVHNHGVIAVSRNVGIGDAKGEYVAFLDSDDWWTSRKLELSVCALEKGADIAYHDLRIVRSAARRFQWARARTRGVSAPVYEDLRERGNALTNSSVVVRRRLLVEIGGLSEEPDAACWEDFDCWLRLAKHGARFQRIRGALGYYWVGSTSASRPERMLAQLDHFKARYLTSTTTDDDEHLPAWFHYAKGRAFYHLGRDRQAMGHMWLALGGRMTPLQQIKTIVTITQLAFRPHRLLSRSSR